MRQRMFRGTLLMSVLFVGACKGDGVDLGSGSEFEGSWEGLINGHANFDDDWEEDPYCTGDASAEVDAAGLLNGTGLCTITYGPAVDETFEVTLMGSIDEEGFSSIYASFEYPDDIRDFEDATLEGSSRATIDAEGESNYTSDQLPGQDTEAFVHLSLLR
jgi:hypothetical protein